MTDQEEKEKAKTEITESSDSSGKIKEVSNRDRKKVSFSEEITMDREARGIQNKDGSKTDKKFTGTVKMEASVDSNEETGVEEPGQLKVSGSVDVEEGTGAEDTEPAGLNISSTFSYEQKEREPEGKKSAIFEGETLYERSKHSHRRYKKCVPIICNNC